MKILFVVLILLLFPVHGIAAVYQTTDADGNIVFTDRPEPGSDKKVAIPSSVVKIKKTDKPSEKKAIQGLGKFKKQEKKAEPYTKFSIIAPLHDKSIRNNIGNVELKLSITPSLQTKFGHQIKVEYDGKMQNSSWKSTTILFNNVDRGSHTFKAYIVDKNGSKLKSSNSVLFHLHRFSRLFN